MAEAPDIHPDHFDLLISGTGLEEALIAGAAARAGKSVLHVDASGAYGSAWRAHDLDSLIDWTSALQHVTTQRTSPAIARDVVRGQGGATSYTHVSLALAEGAIFGLSREYNIDLAPKALYCAGPMVDALVTSGAHHYTEFKALKSSYLWRSGRLLALPASRSDVFAMEDLSLQHRRSFTRFLAVVQDAINGEVQQAVFDDRPFVDLLKERGIPAEVRELFYAIILSDSDQEHGGPSAAHTPDSCPQTPHQHAHMNSADSNVMNAASSNHGNGIISAKEGLAAMRLHVKSAAKFGPSSSALILPCYGTAELPQAFCRVAAVAGALYILRCPLDKVCLEGSGTQRQVTAVHTAAGQRLNCKAFAGDIEAWSRVSSQTDLLGSCDGSMSEDVCRVARAIAVVDRPIVQEGSEQTTALVVCPPRSLPSNNIGTVRILQVGKDTSAAPAGRWVLYASSKFVCSPQNDSAGCAALSDTLSALEQLVNLPPAPSADHSQDAPVSPTSVAPQQIAAAASAMDATQHSAAAPVVAAGRPNALLVLSYLQSTAGLAQEDLPCNAACSGLPDGDLDFARCIDRAVAAYNRLFPNDTAATRETLFSMKRSSIPSEHQNGDARLHTKQVLNSAGSASSSDDDTLAALQSALQNLGSA